jgi:DNA recombination protein RmuC
VRDEARRICDKNIAPPHTTDFALLFLPTEGLYAEVISRPGLFEALQQSCRVTIAGPSTLSALLNSLRMGFRTLAIEQRSSEVWQVLAAVKSEFGKFSGILERAEKQINTVGKSLGDAGRKTRTIERRLRGVETLSVPDAKLLIDEILPAPDGDEDDDTADAAG